MKIFIFHASAGHGHKRVAEVIRRAFLARGDRPEQIHLEDALDHTPPFFRRSYPTFYYVAVRFFPKLWGWCYEKCDQPALYALIRPFRTLVNRWVGAKLLREVAKENPDLIICTHFFSAEVFAQAKKTGQIQATLLTVITDYFPHTFWVHEETDAYWIMSEEGAVALRQKGIPPSKVHVGGIPVDPSFKPSGRKQHFLKKYGGAPDRMTLLITSGSFGLGPTEKILAALSSYRHQIQCFVVCGNNEALQSKLEMESFDFPVKVFGFVDFFQELMEASDLVITKPGGATSTESLVKGVPMVVLSPIPGQETRNAQLLKDRNVSFFMKEPEQINLILKAILDHPDLLEDKRRQIQKLANPHAADDLVSFALEWIDQGKHDNSIK